MVFVTPRICTVNSPVSLPTDTQTVCSKSPKHDLLAHESGATGGKKTDIMFVSGDRQSRLVEDTRGAKTTTSDAIRLIPYSDSKCGRRKRRECRTAGREAKRFEKRSTPPVVVRANALLDRSKRDETNRCVGRKEGILTGNEDFVRRPVVSVGLQRCDEGN